MNFYVYALIIYVQGLRVVTVAPTGREIVGLFASVDDRFYVVGFLTRLRMGDFPWRTLKSQSLKI